MAFQPIRRERENSSGELHWNCRLTDYDRHDIVGLVNQGRSFTEIGRFYSITPGHVGRIYRKAVEDGRVATRKARPNHAGTDV